MKPYIEHTCTQNKIEKYTKLKLLTTKYVVEEQEVECKTATQERKLQKKVRNTGNQPTNQQRNNFITIKPSVYWIWQAKYVNKNNCFFIVFNLSEIWIYIQTPSIALIFVVVMIYSFNDYQNCIL